MPRYPIRARRRPGRVGLFRRVFVVGEAAVEPVAHAVPIADTLALADSLSRVVTYARSPADGVALTDQALDAQGLRVGDTLVTSDSLARVHTAARAVDDAVALTDSVTPVEGAGHTANPSDPVAVADVRSRSVPGSKTAPATPSR